MTPEPRAPEHSLPLPVCRYKSPFVLTIQAVSSLSATNTAWGRASYQCRFPLMVTFPQAKARLDFCSIFQRRAPVNKNSSHCPKNIGRFTQKTSFWVLRRQIPTTFPLLLLQPQWGKSLQHPVCSPGHHLPVTVWLQVPRCSFPHL